MSATAKVVISYDVAVNLVSGHARWHDGVLGTLEKMIDEYGAQTFDKKKCVKAIFRVPMGRGTEGRVSLRTVYMREIRGFCGGIRHETPSKTASILALLAPRKA